MLVRTSSLPLFADIGQFNILAETKSIMSAAEAEDYQISLGNLLDKENIERIVFEQYLIEATPFREGYSTDEVSLTSENLFESAPDSLSCSKLFLVNTLDTETDTTDLMVVTMIPDHVYLSEHDVSEITYLDKAEYSGIILYSDIDGAFREAGYFKRGRILAAEPLSSGNPSPEDGEVHYLTTYQNVGTKATGGKGLLKKLLLVFALDDGGGYYNGGELDDAVCAASRTDSPGQPEQPEIKESPNIRTGGGGGVGPAKATTKSVSNEKQQYKVTLYASRTKEKYCGQVYGSGTYASGSRITCYASPSEGYWFERWTGNMPAPSHEATTFNIHENITATALFLPALYISAAPPCWDASRNIANPLHSMKLAPTGSGNLNLAVFGLNMPERNSGTHAGIDLAAEVGTPIYAPCDGTIAANKRYVVEQPDGDYKKHPQGIDNNKAGNRFSLQCVLSSGEKVTFSFFHLQAGNPVAVNPRTGVPFIQGDKVYQGEIIGYTGRTGNAYNIPNPHLHLEAFNSKGEHVDPELYLNGTVQRKSGRVSAAEITGIICNDKDIMTSNNNYTDAVGMYF